MSGTNVGSVDDGWEALGVQSPWPDPIDYRISMLEVTMSAVQTLLASTRSLLDEWLAMIDEDDEAA